MDGTFPHSAFTLGLGANVRNWTRPVQPSHTIRQYLKIPRVISTNLHACCYTRGSHVHVTTSAHVVNGHVKEPWRRIEVCSRSVVAGLYGKAACQSVNLIHRWSQVKHMVSVYLRQLKIFCNVCGEDLEVPWYSTFGWRAPIFKLLLWLKICWIFTSAKTSVKNHCQPWSHIFCCIWCVKAMWPGWMSSWTKWCRTYKISFTSKLGGLTFECIKDTFLHRPTTKMVDCYFVWQLECNH